jgi:hypothetical protein
MGFVAPEHYLSTDANIALDERGNYQANYGEYATSQTVRIGAIMVLVIPTTIMLIAIIRSNINKYFRLNIHYFFSNI